MSRFATVLAALSVGVALGWGLPSAKASGSKWDCYVVDRLPDLAKASDRRGAKATADGLNLIAPNAVDGEMITVQYPTTQFSMGAQADVGLICTKGAP